MVYMPEYRPGDSLACRTAREKGHHVGIQLSQRCVIHDGVVEGVSPGVRARAGHFHKRDSVQKPSRHGSFAKLLGE